MSRRALHGLTLLLATALVMTFDPALAADVTVQMQKPESFKDFKATCVGIDERTRGMLADLTQFIRTTGARYLRDGDTLEITVTDVDMAGEFETWRGPQACSVRVMLDIYSPRVVLDFRLADRDGKVLSAGHRDLSDPPYLTRAVMLSTDPLRYEKNLLADWLQKDFAGRTGGASGNAR